jgi:putative hydrolase of the HAD superfamily
MVRAVIFDMDDTLIDWSGRTGEWVDVLKVHLRPIYERLDAEGHILPSIDWLAYTYSEQARIAWDQAVPPELTAPRQVDILRNALIALGLEEGQFDAAALQQIFAWDVMPGLRPFPDAEFVLRTLRNSGLRTGVLTNSSMPSWMREIELRAFGLLDLLDVCMTAGDAGRLKPHPDPFRLVAERLGATVQETVFVGDRLRDDVAGAQAAGMLTVWVRRPSSMDADEIIPHATIDNLTDLLDKLDDLSPGWRHNHDN